MYLAWTCKCHDFVQGHEVSGQIHKKNCEGGGRVMFTRARKCLDDGKDLNTLFDSPMDNVLKIRENFKAKYKDDYNSENGSEHFSIKK